MDELPGSRHQKLEIYEAALSAGAEAQKAREAGQTSLFDLFGESNTPTEVSVSAIPLPNIKETPEHKKEALAWEKELLGMYVSNDHPVAQALQGVDDSGTIPVSKVSDEHVGQSHTFIGMLTGVRHISTKKGSTMLVGVLEDLESSIEIVVFSRALEKYETLLKDEAVLRITGKVDNRRDTLQIVVDRCEEVTPAEQTDEPDEPEQAAVPLEMDVEDLAAAEAAEPESAPDRTSAATEPTAEAAQTGEAAADEQADQTDPPPTEAAAPSIRTVEGPVQAIRGRSRVSSASASGKNSNTGSSTPAPEPAAPTSSNGNGHIGSYHAARTLRLHLPRTEDFDTDTRRMQDVHDLLLRHRGDDEEGDQIRLYMPNGVGTVVLRPYYTVRVSDDLVTRLMGFLGEDNVEVV
jgi:DNA polymerase-3 subunit alpha